MEKKVYISEIESERCQRVADAYSELYEHQDLFVTDAGRYGFVIVQYYVTERGFDNVFTFRNSQDLFEYLWKEWLYSELLAFAKGTPLVEMEYEFIFQCMQKEKQKEIMDKRMYFAEKAGLPEYGVDTDETWCMKESTDA